MKENYTHISVILDRTGSMESIRDDTIGGFNTFLKDQQAQSNAATLTLVQFDTQDPYEKIHSFRPIHEVPELTHETFVPRASTPLLDAIGRGINDLEHHLAGMEETHKPSKVILMIITDGQENSSKEFRREQIVKMLQQKQTQDKWQILFLSADLDAINDAEQYGIQRRSSLAFDKAADGVRAAFGSASRSVSRYRESTDGSYKVEFTEEDRQQQQSEQKRKKPKSTS